MASNCSAWVPKVVFEAPRSGRILLPVADNQMFVWFFAYISITVQRNGHCNTSIHIASSRATRRGTKFDPNPYPLGDGSPNPQITSRHVRTPRRRSGWCQSGSTHDSDHAKCGGVLTSTPSWYFCQSRMRLFGTDFRPYISSVGQNRISFFSNIWAKVQARLVKLAALIDCRTFYRHMSTDARYYFRFRHRAPLKIFRFSRLTPKRGYVLHRVVLKGT